MKTLTDYPTPETDKAERLYSQSSAAYAVRDTARSLEQRLALAREALAMFSNGHNNAADKALSATAPKP